MTIIAGFKSREGIVICADTQETVSNISKRNVPKLRFEPVPLSFYGEQGHEGDNVAAAFCGAGHGPFIDKLVDGAWEVAQSCMSLDDACTEIETSIKATYKEFGRIYQRGLCPEVELIYGVKMLGESKLFSAVGPIVNERRDYASGGSGYYMADFLKKRMYSERMSLLQCVILSAYVLFQAKEHVDGCGGESHIAVLRESGVSGRVDQRRVESVTQLLQKADGLIGDIILGTANLELNGEEFKKLVILRLNALDEMRSTTKQEIENARATWQAVSRILSGPTYKEQPTDAFGLPMPSTSET